MLTLPAFAIDLSKVNFNYLYDGSLDIKHQIALKSETFELFLALNKKPTQLKLLYQNNYNDINHQEINALDSAFKKSNEFFHLAVSFQNIPSFNLLVLEFEVENITYYYDIQINSGLKLDYPDFVLKSATDSTVIMDNYIKLGQPVLTSNPLFSYVYEYDFGIARPATSTINATGQKIIKVDSMFIVKDKVTLDSLHQLYFFQSDSSTNLGRGLLTVAGYFPKMKTSEELLAPLIYISTRKESVNFKKAKDKKKSFENFWIRNLKSKERAKKAIKNYYRNITKSNQYFTNYKPGWKTDPGMILTVFGTPTNVNRDEQKEIWTYLRYGEEITFNFEKMPNLFVRQHLHLLRDAAYSTYWYREVASWRTGSL